MSSIQPIPKSHSLKYYAPNQPFTVLQSLHQLTEQREDGVLWATLINPSNADLAQLVSPLVKQERVLDEMKTKHRRPKVVEYGGVSLLVAITTKIDKGIVRFGECQILFGEGFIVSVWRNTSLSDSTVQEYLEDTPELISRGADYIVAEILDFITDDYTEGIQQFEQQVEKAEGRFFIGAFQKKDIEQLYRLRRTLLHIQNSIAPLSELARRFTRQNVKYIGDDSRAYFSEVADRIARQAELIKALRDTLAFAFEAGMMIVQLQQNDITRKLAAWAAIFAIPTAVAGIYGMNFTYMPELNLSFGYPLVLGAVGALCIGLHRRFKKIGWL